MNKMQQQTPQTTNSASGTPLNLVSTEQIQKYLNENKNLIMAILESQNLGKMAECAQYQVVLQKNLMYLAAIADAQPPPSGTPSQPGSDLIAPSQPGNRQTQTPIMQQQHAGAHMGNLAFQLNTTTPTPTGRSQQEQKNQQLHFQQQQRQMQQAHFGGSNNNMHLLMQPGVDNSGNGHGNSAMGPMEGTDR